MALMLVVLVQLLAWWRMVSWPNPARRVTNLGRGTRAGHHGHAVVALGILCAVGIVVRVGQLATAIALTIAAVCALRLWLRWRRDRERDTAERAEVEFFGALCGYLEAGVTPQAAIRQAAELEAHRNGRLRNLVLELERAPGVSQEPVAQLWSAAAYHGLPTAKLVEQVRLRIEHRLRHREQTKAALSGAQSTATVLSILPLAGIALGSGMGANPLGVLFGGGPGGLLLIAGIGLIAAGLGWSRGIIERAGRGA